MRNRSIIKFIFILNITIFSCKKSDHPVIDLFNEIQEHQQHLRFNELKPILNQQSITFVGKLIDARNKTDLMKIGNTYKLNYFMAEYYRWNRGFNTNFEDIIRLFNLLQFSFFDLKYQFNPLQNKSKHSNNYYFLPISYKFYGSNNIRWLRFTLEDNQIYKYDLIYSLQQEEKEYKERYKHNLLKNENKDKIRKYEVLYEVLPEIKRTPKDEKMTIEGLNKERNSSR